MNGKKSDDNRSSGCLGEADKRHEKTARQKKAETKGVPHPAGPETTAARESGLNGDTPHVVPVSW